jgi:hypothetical protein
MLQNLNTEALKAKEELDLSPIPEPKVANFKRLTGATAGTVPLSVTCHQLKFHKS